MTESFQKDLDTCSRTVGRPPASWAPLLLHPLLPVEPGKGGDWDSLGVGLVQRAGVGAVSCRGPARGSRARNAGGHWGQSQLLQSRVRGLIPEAPRPEGTWGLQTHSRRSWAAAS